ncbi:S1 family peptidase [Lysobacter sp. A3-1-A15]|uniref:S1 family peptidase n=1 Tax=Novilysobacter viscosus TaxID=3098602 RepID=UPI002ED95787
MHKFVPWAVSPIVLAISMAVSAAPGDLPSPQMRATMQRDLNMTSAQLAQYLKVERVAVSQGEALARAQGRHFAGSWIERKPNGTYEFVLATTAPGAKASAPGLSFRSARHSLAHLKASKSELDVLASRHGSAPEGVYAWGVDVRNNTVTVDVAPGAQAAAIDFVAASGADVSVIRFNTMHSAPRLLATLEGGSEYLSQSGGSYYYCSVGFGVTQNGVEGYVTAGHCGNTNDGVFTLANRRTVGPQIGSFKSSFFGGSGDGAHVQLFAGSSVSATVDGYNQPVRGQAVAPEGAAVCRSGRTTGLKCGTILRYNQTVNYPEATINGLTSVKVCAEGGDSGGSFISGDQAQGVLSGGNYSCKGKQASLATSYFQPIAEILGSQLTLKTSN